MNANDDYHKIKKRINKNWHKKGDLQYSLSKGDFKFNSCCKTIISKEDL